MKQKKNAQEWKIYGEKKEDQNQLCWLEWQKGQWKNQIMTICR